MGASTVALQNAGKRVDAGNPLPVTVAGTSAVGAPSTTAVTVQGAAFTSSAAQTRPNDTTAYAALDVVGTTAGTAIEFTNIGPAGGRILIASSLLRIDVAAVPAGMGNQRLHLFDAAPTAIADNAAFDLPSGDRAKYLGWIDLGTPTDLGATIVAQADQHNKVVKLATGSTSLWGFRQTLVAYTPTAEAASTITLHAAAL